MGKLEGKVAVITGGSAGIGLATAKLFVSEGAKVIITGREQAALDAAVKEIGGATESIRSDVSVMSDLDALCDHIKANYDHVDIIFANAGGGRARLFEDTSPDDFDFAINVNFKGSYFLVQKLLPIMPAGSSVIFNTSTLSKQGRPYVSVYAAMKAALRSLARSLTAELSSKGIRVNALAPGHIETELARKGGMSEDAIAHARAQAHAETPMNRSGMPEELAAAALFLASSDSSFVTGIELHVNGGRGEV